MADELDLDLDNIQDQQEQINKTELRIKNLSEKVKLTSQERDEFAKAKDQLEAEKATALKEVDFFKNFNPLVSKYQGAADFQDKIKEKVMAGYEIEDATISILAKEGKLPTSVETPPVSENPAGGSAVNTIRSGEEKALTDMSREEKKAALEEAIARGDISLS